MKSAVINAQSNQYTLDFEPGLTDTYSSLRECVAARIYKKGLGAVAIDLDEAPGNLSVQLSASEVRHFSVDNFELYLEKQKDFTPIYYLIEKFLADKSAGKDAAMAQVVSAVGELVPLLKKAGLL